MLHCAFPSLSGLVDLTVDAWTQETGESRGLRPGHLPSLHGPRQQGLLWKNRTPGTLKDRAGSGLTKA